MPGFQPTRLPLLTTTRHLTDYPLLSYSVRLPRSPFAQSLARLLVGWVIGKHAQTSFEASSAASTHNPIRKRFKRRLIGATKTKIKPKTKTEEKQNTKNRQIYEILNGRLRKKKKTKTFQLANKYNNNNDAKNAAKNVGAVQNKSKAALQ